MCEPDLGLQEMARPLMDIYRVFGWPGEGYKKEEVFRRVRQCDERMDSDFEGNVDERTETQKVERVEYDA